MTKHKDQDIIPSLYALRHMWNEWVGVLSAEEYQIAMFVYMRTYAFQKTSEIITVEQFSEGLYDKDGNCVTAGTGYSRRQLFRIQKSLKDKKVLITTPHLITTRDGVVKNTRLIIYSLNLTIYRTNLAPQLKKLPKPQCQKWHREGDKNDTMRVSEMAPLKEYGEKSKEKVQFNKLNFTAERENSNVIQMSEFMEPKNDIADICKNKAAGIASRNKGKRDDKANRNDLTGWYKTWNNTMLEYYPKVPQIAWTAQTSSMFRKFLNRGLMDKGQAGKDFLVKSIANWDYITRTYFKKMEQVPAIPSLRFFLKFHATFIEAVHYIDEGRATPKAAKAPGNPDLTKKLLHKQSLAHKRELAEREAAHQAERDALLRQLGQAPAAKPVYKMPKKPVRINGKLMPDWEEHNG